MSHSTEEHTTQTSHTPNSTPQLTFERLRAAVDGNIVAIRSKITLQPVGGTNDKVFPPTYAVDSNADHKYAIEERVSEDGSSTSTTILLDSVASQANRAELALLEGWKSGELKFPAPYVDFSENDKVTDYDRLSVLEAPHRIFDAIFRDSTLDETLFRLSDIGRKITEATPRDATELFRHSPTSLLFGAWDSTGPKGGLGTKFQRAYVSEIVGFDAKIGKKVRSRIDPLHIEKVESKDIVFNSSESDEVWTTNPDEAAKDKKGNPVPASRGESGTPGQPAKINHGNITPTIDELAGGVTISKAIQTTLISLAALRRLHFKQSDNAKEHSHDAETAARTAIAALGVAAIAYQYEADFDLRSRCLLIPTSPPYLELVARDGSTEIVTINRSIAREILSKATEHSSKTGCGWADKEISLKPAEKLLELLRRSRKVNA